MRKVAIIFAIILTALLFSCKHYKIQSETPVARLHEHYNAYTTYSKVGKVTVPHHHPARDYYYLCYIVEYKVYEKKGGEYIENKKVLKEHWLSISKSAYETSKLPTLDVWKERHHYNRGEWE